MLYSPYITKSIRLFSQSAQLRTAQLTLFTKDTCQLCTNARTILEETLASEELKGKEIDLKVIDIMDPANEKWFDVYCYDVPVLHVDRSNQPKPVKFMHYFHHDKLLQEFLKEEIN
ncbi:uncharacterized protein KQ657_005087 [Scheffersomyces spartinae]|uniref:Glutaredoxin-like protein n=1 Tax=Scheffersomyces spartinae TaxID=45513 RepID=A0A9P8AI00_9ASCO|nr:uncharacterized protein KQ657_005087 [Scheffersomyces spartinae]KAG7193888.1 hypothetical protein KQ657_005087 [Scheffersomyces spartinae]